MPESVRLGTSSWSFPGWEGLVYDRAWSEEVLAREGLAAYANHPLLRTVGIDRTYYRPMTAEQLRPFADAVPESFRFLVKADRVLTSPLEPTGYGVRGANPLFLNSEYARREVVEPLLAGLGAKAGPVLFQFPPFAASLVGGRSAFVQRLATFLAELPAGPLYAVELRTPALLTQSYAEALAANGAAHCYNVHPAMSSLARQLELLQPFYQPALVIRWMLGGTMEYEAARDLYHPFDRLVDEDHRTRGTIATAVIDATLGERNAFVIADNKAEGSAPLTLFRLAERIAGWSRG